MLLSPARRDNADDFFTIAILPVCMYDKKGGADPGFDRNGANCVPTHFPALIHPIKADQAIFVLKDQRRQLE